MSNELTIPNRRVPALRKKAEGLARHAKAQNTIDTYRKMWQDFDEYCDGIAHVTSLPASPATLVDYIAFLSDEQKVSTIQTKVAAIAFRHRAANLPDPTKVEAVRETLIGLRKKMGMHTVHKAPVEQDLLERMVRAQPDSLTGWRNRALLLVGFSCDLRRSELVALKVNEVEFRSDRMVVRISHSKTDPSGEGYEINVPRLSRAARITCAVTALEKWLAAADVHEGPLFRKVDRWGKVWQRGLNDETVSKLVKEAAQTVGLDPDQFAGHSLRRGMITQLAVDGENTSNIRMISRHKTDTMVDVYRADAERTQMRAIRTALTGDKEE